MAQFFIGRPIFAIVLAIVISLSGLLAVFTLPVAQYPAIAPPTVSIAATYRGASAKTVDNSVTQVIEQAMTGLDSLIYIQSSSKSSSGASRVRLTFAAGTDPDIAQVQVQNKLQSALPRLPQQVRDQGVTTYQSGGSTFLVYALVSSDDHYDVADLGDFISSRLTDPLARVDGVSEAHNYASEYAMRIWLDPNKLYSYDLTPSAVVDSINAQNANVSAGQLGGLPTVAGQKLNATVTARSRLTSVEQFKNILVKSTASGANVRLDQLGHVELGSDEYAEISRYNGQLAAPLSLELSAGANAVATANRVKARMAELQQYFPPGVEAKVAYETTPFVKASIKEVIKTLFEAIALVVLIMFAFLQNWRATLIPALAVPVVILGTFGVLALAGFTINTLTLFAIVLAIGLLVDDAIVVVENVERVMAEYDLSPAEATRRSMHEISSALVGIALVLSAVFMPMAFFGGATGVIYRQFSVAIVAAMVLSILVALTLTPALCATLLKPPDDSAGARRWLGGLNRLLRPLPGVYVTSVAWMIRHRLLILAAFAVIVVAVGALFTRIPSGFLPTEDQGVLRVGVQLAPGATADRTERALGEIEHYFRARPNVDSVFGIVSDDAQNKARAYVHLVDWSKRTGDTRSAGAIAARASAAFKHKIRDARVFVRQPPTLHNLGNSAGFQLELQDVGGVGLEKLKKARRELVERAKASPKLAEVRAQVAEPAPKYALRIDDAKARALGVSTESINDTLSIALGGRYIGDFVYDGRVKKVFVQGEAPYRMAPEDIGDWYVQSNKGGMVPFSAFANGSWDNALPKLERYDGKRAFEIIGQSAAGISPGVAMDTIKKLVTDLPAGIGFQWSGISLQQKQAGNQAPLLYAVSIGFVFLCLAALYESWSVPFAVMLVVPLGVLGALAATFLRGLSADVYFQVGVLTTIGLAAKNAILIVEFAYSQVRAGGPLIDSTLRAARLRLRPIVMTSLAFGMGVLPLVVSTGAGSAARHAVGTGVFGGVIFATLLGIGFVPVFFVLMRAGLRRLDQSERFGRENK